MNSIINSFLKICFDLKYVTSKILSKCTKKSYKIITGVTIKYDWSDQK